ncbi:MAG: hypothetical protein KIG65_04690 [Eubacteriales bacterium]|nr:hypothetical protein [Eubacteriales bacterium]
MILFIGEKALFDFVYEITPNVTYDVAIESAEKLIVCDASDAAVAAVKAAILINIPILGIHDGYRAVAKAFGARCETLESCAEGKQEWAIIDNNSAIFCGLEKVIKICRGTPVAVIEAVLPSGLDCIARAETGEVVAFENFTAPGISSNIFAINLHPASGLTPVGADIINNFVNLG